MRTRRWQAQQQQRDTLGKSAATLAATSSDGDSSDSDTPATTRGRHHQKQNQTEQLHGVKQRAAWDDDTLVCLLQLRYIEMDAHFRDECLTSVDTADAWSVLASELNLRMEVAFSSLQCRSRITALRKRWNERSIANIRNGTEQRTKHVETIKLLTRLYRRGVVVPLQQMGKIVPRSDCRGHKRFAAGISEAEEEDEEAAENRALALRRKQQEDVGDYEEEEDATSLDGDENEQQLHMDEDGIGAVSAAAVAAVWSSNTPMTLERRHLELFRRQVLAEEAIAQCTQQQLEATKQRIRAEREQLRLSRDELELKLFTMTAAEPDGERDRVKYEFVVMKRRQVRDRLVLDVVLRERLEKETESKATPRLTRRPKRR